MNSPTATTTALAGRPGTRRQLGLAALGAAGMVTLGGATAAHAQAPQPPPAMAVAVQLAFGLTTGNALIRFNTAAPALVLGRATLSGLQPGETLVGMDFRPANNALYGVGASGRVYTIDPASGAARAVGAAPISPAPRGGAFGVDVNPVPDRLRLVSTEGQNLRINMDTLEVIEDGALAYAPGDRNAAARPNVVAAGYTNNMAGAQATMLYVIDSGPDVLALQNPPNDGVLNTVGPIGLNTTDLTAFDVAPGTGTAFAALTPAGANASTLYRIDLGSGAARAVGPIGGGQPLRGLALVLDGTATFPAGGAAGMMLPRTGAAADPCATVDG
jgi:hypothetical protein